MPDILLIILLSIFRFSSLLVGLGYIFKSIPYIASAILIVDDVEQSATEDEEGQLGPILKYYQ